MSKDLMTRALESIDIAKGTLSTAAKLSEMAGDLWAASWLEDLIPQLTQHQILICRNWAIPE